MQRAGVRSACRHGAPQQHGAGIEARIHEHDADAGFGVAGHDGAGDRRGAAPARQQRGVDVQAAAPRGGKNGGRQEKA